MDLWVYVYIYIYIYVLSASRKPSGRFLWFPSSTPSNVLFMVSVVGFFMVSVVAGNMFFMVSVAGFLVDSAAAGGSKILELLERCLVFVFLGLVSVVGCLMVFVTFCYGFRYAFYGFHRWIFDGFCRLRRIQNFRTSRAMPCFWCF